MNHKYENDKFLKEVEKRYDEFAEAYACLESSLEIVKFDRGIISLIEPLRGKKILDAGCGPGIFSFLMAERGAYVVGIDISFRLLEIASKRCEGLPNCQFLKANIDSLDRCFKDKFDIVLSAFEIMYHRDLRKIFKVFNAVLRQHGQLLLLLPHPVRNMGMHNPYDYFKTGCFEEKWSIRKRDEKYYYKLEDYINILIEGGFCIKKLIEPEAPRQKIAMYDVDIKFPKDSKYPQAIIMLMEKSL